MAAPDGSDRTGKRMVDATTNDAVGTSSFKLDPRITHILRITNVRFDLASTSARRLAQPPRIRDAIFSSEPLGTSRPSDRPTKLSLRKAEPTATRDFITTAQPICSQRTNSTNCRRQKNPTMPQSVARAAAPLSTPFASSNPRSRWPRVSTRPAQTLSNPPLPAARRPIHPCWSRGRRALLSAHGLSGRPVPRLLAKRSGT